jgi:hypothetical protein
VVRHYGAVPGAFVSARAPYSRRALSEQTRRVMNEPLQPHIWSRRLTHDPVSLDAPVVKNSVSRPYTYV